MVEKKTILLSEICRQALATRAPGEDLDEALLRAVKKLYPEEGFNLFTTVKQMLQMRGGVQGKSSEEMVAILAQGQESFEMTQTTTTTTTVSRSGNMKALDDLDLSAVPPEMKTLVEQALKEGNAVQTSVRMTETKDGMTQVYGSGPSLPQGERLDPGLFAKKPKESGGSRLVRWFKSTFLGGPD